MSLRSPANIPHPRERRPVVLVQLPFPSQVDPEPTLEAYYAVYEQLYRRLVPSYQTSSGDLWETPLWVAHLDGAISREDTEFLDLSRVPPTVEACVAAISKRTPSSAYLFLSPLAQNFELALRIAAEFRGSSRLTVLGGNMARLASPDWFDIVFIGQATADLYERIERQASGIVGSRPRLGSSQPPSGFRARYRLLSDFDGRVPMVRLNASHGCLFGCTFCGDGWSRQLHVVPYDDLASELEEIEATFPAVQCIYVGDKTFGQSRTAVENLIRLSALSRRRYQYIVQTHVTMIDDWLLDAMDRLGVTVVEMGMESADPEVLKSVRKGGSRTEYRQAIERLQRRGKSVLLNVLGGLPYETEESHEATLAFLRDTADLVYAYNLYNFVPYPETQLFNTLKPRIIDWNFANWREDRPVVFEPYKISRERAWEQFLALISSCTELCATRAAGFDSYERASHG